MQKKMGLFDDVIFEMKCPVCGCMIDDFQTKSMSNTMSVYDISQLPDEARFYSSCDNCGLWVEFIKHHVYTRKERIKSIEKFMGIKLKRKFKK